MCDVVPEPKNIRSGEYLAPCQAKSVRCAGFRVLLLSLLLGDGSSEVLSEELLTVFFFFFLLLLLLIRNLPLLVICNLIFEVERIEEVVLCVVTGARTKTTNICRTRRR